MYLEYFTAGTSYFGLFLAIVLLLAAQGALIAPDYWLSMWLVLFDFSIKLLKMLY